MSSVVLTCPIDGLALSTQAMALKGDASRDPHVHLNATTDAACPNGHRWRADVDITLEKADGR